MTKKEKEVYVIGILNCHKFSTEIKFVTSVDYSTSDAKWEDGEKAMEFSKKLAKEISFGLCMNGYAAVPILKASYFKFQNPKKERCD